MTAPELSNGTSDARETVTRRRLRVAFMPFNRENQYWQQLARHLEAQGIQVTECRMLKGLIRQLWRGTCDHDVLHVQWMPSLAWTWAGLRRIPSFLLHLAILRLLGHRFVWTAHDLYDQEVTCRLADRIGTSLATPFFSGIIAHTETARDLVCREFLILRRTKVAVIPHGHYIDCYPNTISRGEARKHLGLSEAALVFLFLGHIRPYKGVNDLVDAFQQLDAPDCRLVIAGKPLDGETIPTLEARITDRRRVQLHPGFIPDEELQVFLNAADVVVIPYRQGLTSGAVVLGMSFGRACVAAAIGCIPDMLDEEGGFLYGADQPEGLRAALERVVRSRDRLDAMGAHNLERARQWDWEGIARATAQVYARAFGSLRRRSAQARL